MKIGDEVYVHGYVDEIRKDVVIIRNDGGYFGTVEDEVIGFEVKALHKEYVEPKVIIEKTEPLVNEVNDLVKDLVKAFCEDGTWLERQGVYTLTLAEAKQRAVDIIESVTATDEPQTEPNSSEIPNNCEELNAYRKCVESRSFWDHKHCDGCYFDERCPFDEPKDEQNLSEKPTGSEPQTEVSAQEYERWLFKEPQTERSSE